MHKKEYVRVINEKLSEFNLSILEDSAIAEWEAVERIFQEKVKQYGDVNYIILGEAPINAKNFVLDDSSPINAKFLEPSHFGLQTRAELNEFMKANGILPFDLYPLPLPTFIYDKVTFKFQDKKTDNLYKDLLSEHWSILKSIITSQGMKPELIIRYKKLDKRREWKLFTTEFDNLFSNPTSNPRDIYQSFNADPTKIRDIFKIEKPNF